MNSTTLTRRLLRSALVALGALPMVACPDDDPGPGVDGPVTALLVLETPNDEGALLFTITGPAQPEIETLSASHVVFTHEPADDELRVALIGDFSAGAVLGLELPEGDVDDYEVVLEQVSDRQNRLRASHAGYELHIQGLGD